MIIAGLGPPIDAQAPGLGQLFALPAITSAEQRFAKPATRTVPGPPLAALPSLFGAAYRRTYYFGLAGLPQTGLDRTFEYRWDGAKRLGRRVAQQYLGPGEETVSIEGVIYPPNFGDFGMLERMRREAMAGTPRAFVTAYGRYHGLWCIKSIKDKQAPYWPDGHPRKVEFTIELVHYGSDFGGSGGGGGGFAVPAFDLVDDPRALETEPFMGPYYPRTGGSA